MGEPYDFKDFEKALNSDSSYTSRDERIKAAFDECTELNPQHQVSTLDSFRDNPSNADSYVLEVLMNPDIPLENEEIREKKCVFDVQPSFDMSRVSAEKERDEEPAKPMGRRKIKKDGSNPLVRLVQKKNPSKAPKLEYYHTMIIRGFKKAVRIATSNKHALPTGGIFKGLFKDTEALTKWGEFKEFVLRNEELKPASATDTGPATDGQSRRPADEAPEHRTYNKECIRQHFTSEAVREAHYFFIEMLFAGSADQRCEGMKIKCHQRGQHTDECEEKWMSLKTYTQEGMVEEVGWDPFIPQY
jgi:hypothetical protein